ncbi:hypothetical protein CDV36_001445 [Fusarium kuroshium]|uniref:Uncharacterized protein n=1 Tax=Fusarium kuroshium TaxID=2010991 RepID=A0A3M2SMV2_9HYPO|nr:hypothetical protein CDV36_001445 [Fusarium kuroshium]
MRTARSQTLLRHQYVYNSNTSKPKSSIRSLNSLPSTHPHPPINNKPLKSHSPPPHTIRPSPQHLLRRPIHMPRLARSSGEIRSGGSPSKGFALAD